MKPEDRQEKTRLKLLADLSRTEVYKRVLKPLLIDMKLKAELQKTEPTNNFEAVKLSFRRLERMKTVDKIIDEIEGASKKLSKFI